MCSLVLITGNLSLKFVFETTPTEPVLAGVRGAEEGLGGAAIALQRKAHPRERPEVRSIMRRQREKKGAAREAKEKVHSPLLFLSSWHEAFTTQYIPQDELLPGIY